MLRGFAYFMTTNAFQTFFNEFWPVFVVAVIVFPLLQLGRRVSLEGTAAVFVRANCFRELCAFAKDEQKRLLHEADGKAFARWRFFLPALIYAFIFSGSIATGAAIPMAIGLHDSLWLRVGIAVMLVVLGCLLAGRWEARSIRPFLRVHIERAQHAA